MTSWPGDRRDPDGGASPDTGAVVPEYAAGPSGPAGSAGSTGGTRRSGPRGGRRAVLGIGLAFLVAGLLHGLLWSWLAPGARIQVSADGGYRYLAASFDLADFTAIAIFLLLGIVLQVAVAVGAWQARRDRGPRMLATVTVGAVGASVIAWGLAHLLAGGTTELVAAVHAGTTAVVTVAPTPGPWWFGVLPAGLAVGTYTLLAAWHGSPDLGAGSVLATVPPPPRAS